MLCLCDGLSLVDQVTCLMASVDTIAAFFFSRISDSGAPFFTNCCSSLSL